MTRLEEIKNEVVRDIWDDSGASMRQPDWRTYLGIVTKDAVIKFYDEVATRYARECCAASLEKASGKAKIIVSNGETLLDVKSYTLADGIRFSPDRRGITDESNIVLI